MQKKSTTGNDSKSLKYSSVDMIWSLRRIFEANKSKNIEFPSIQSVAWGDSRKYVRRKTKHWTLQLSPAIHPTPIPCPKNTLMGTFENWKKIFLSYCHQLSPLPHPPPKFALERSFCVTIFQSIAMFSCQFAKVAILDHYSWSERLWWRNCRVFQSVML